MELSFEPQKLALPSLLTQLASSDQGLSEREAAERLLRDGPNFMTEHPRVPLALQFMKHLGNWFALLLWLGALLSYVGSLFQLGEGMELIAVALIAVILVNAGFTLFQEWRVERAMGAFKGMMAQQARVVRDGREQELDVTQIVSGDLLVLREGDRVGADARLLQVNQLKVDNAPLTGESEPQLRTADIVPTATRLASRNLVFAGTLVTSGTGQAVVYSTGNQTEIGRIAGVMRTTKRQEPPIKKELRHFIRVISTIALLLGLLFFAISYWRGNPFWINLMFAIGIILSMSILRYGLTKSTPIKRSKSSKRTRGSWPRPVSTTCAIILPRPFPTLKSVPLTWPSILVFGQTCLVPKMPI